MFASNSNDFLLLSFANVPVLCQPCVQFGHCFSFVLGGKVSIAHGHIYLRMAH